MKIWLPNIFVILLGCGVTFAQDKQPVLLDPNINDEQEILNMRKLDLRPGDILPRTDNQYTLGGLNYRWLNLVSSSGTINNFVASSATITNLSVANLVATGALGKIAQIVIFSTGTSVVTTANAFQDTLLISTITPISATNKILIFVSGDLKNTAPSTTVGAVTVTRGVTELSGLVNGFAATTGGATTPGFTSQVAFFATDSPASTSATDYRVKIRSSDNASSVRFGEQSKQVMILIEYVP